VEYVWNRHRESLFLLRSFFFSLALSPWLSLAQVLPLTFFIHGSNGGGGGPWRQGWACGGEAHAARYTEQGRALADPVPDAH
jgi:hypothetical protein